MKRLYKQLTLNTLYQFAGKGLNIVLALITLSILSRYLGIKGMGEYGTILRYLGFFGIIADLGLNVITTREISKMGLTSKAKILANAFTLRLVTAVMILGFSLILSYFLPYSLEVKQGFFITSLAFLFILLTQIFNGVFQKHLVTQKSSFADVCSKLATLVISIYLVLQKASLLTLLWAIVAGTFLSFVLTLYFSNKYYQIALKFDWNIWRKLLKYAWPVALSNFLILVYFNIDALMLSWMKPMEEVGLYHVSYKILETFFQFMVLFIGLFVPIFTKNLLHKIRFKKHLQTAFNGVLFFGIPLLFAGTLFSEDLILLVNGEAFIAAVPILQVLFLATLFLFINHLMHNAMTVLDLQKKALWIYAFCAGFNIIANLYAIKNYGAQGAAFTTLLSELLICILIYLFFLRHQKFYPSVRYGGKVLLISLAMFLAILSVNQMDLIIKLCVGSVVYFGLYFMFLTKEEV